MLSVPRMEILVRQQARKADELIIINQRALFAAVIGALMMLQAVVARAITEREQKMITVVMTSAKQCGILGGHSLIGLQTFGAHAERGLTVGRDIYHMLRR